MNQTLLVELLTEELPPKALLKLGQAFADGISQGLKSRDFLGEGAQVEAFASPRRLAISISQVRASSPDKTLREKILPVSVAIDANGEPTAPLRKKLAAMGFAHLTLADLERAPDGKTESLFTTYTAPGIALAQGLQAALDETLSKLPIPKLMSYQRPDGSTVQFVRPAHKLVALHGSDVVPIQTLGLMAGRQTLGHRFMAKGVIEFAHADQYNARLVDEGKVMANVRERKEKIRLDLLAMAGDDLVLMPESLLDEVTALVEWPVVYACHFESEFLQVPQECLILTMQTNQKYFALTDANGRLRNRFLIVSNLATSNPAHIIDGNERVVRPRLSDAKFFFGQDQKKPLADRLPGLAHVVYHNKLGTQLERSSRVQALAGNIAQLLGHDVSLATRAAQLAKADLLTDMVGEFPELQGIMGTYYARHDGEQHEVAQAISEHYQPRFAGDALPATHAGLAVALADKLETLIGIWGIGLAPTGDKDPFALRRHALGVLRMLLEKRLPLNLPALLAHAATLFEGNPQFTDAATAVLAFMYDRLRGLLRERGFSANEIEAVVSQQPSQLDNIIERLQAVQAFAAMPEAEALAAANKRITNILKKNDAAGAASPATVQQEYLRETAEQGLYSAMNRIHPLLDSTFATQDFTATLRLLAQLRGEVDAFFNDVMVMDEDLQLRANRLALLAKLHEMMNRVADISKLAA
jgi:glycyl-tRNA synthetase beta chain